MQRQRRKDLNLKPNRVLDKRSSRGMIFENEELRLRTLAIADDVDRGQNDIRKLRKENDHLKREIWSLRDECEKLEEILKKFVAKGNFAFDLSDLPYPELFMDDNMSNLSTDPDDEAGYSGGAGQGEEEDDQNMFMIDDDTGSVVDVGHCSSPQGQGQDPQAEGGWDDPRGQGIHPSPEIPIGFEELAAHTRFPTADVTTTGLASLKEESESMMTLPQTMSPSPPELPDPEQLGVFEQTPVIEITPASSPSNQLDSVGSLTPDAPETPDNFQDGGCIAVVPKTYQVTSQIHIEDRSKAGTSASSRPVTSLPPPSPPNKSKKITHRAKIRGSSGGGASGSGSGCAASANLNAGPHPHQHSNILPVDWARNGGLGGSFGGFIINRFCPSCYQSEPSLASAAVPEDYPGKMRPLTFDPMMGLGLQSFMSNSGKSAWSCIEKNLVVGFVEDLNQNQKDAPSPSGSGTAVVIKSQDVIDELETRFDPTLEKIKGIRILSRTVFLCLRDEDTVIKLLEQAGREQFIVKNSYAIRFADGSQRYTKVVLSGIGPEVSDDTVVSMLNQLGQVLGPVQRRSYKGVEIWEREAQMHLVKHPPHQLIIGGYDTSVSATTADCADGNGPLCQLPVITTETDSDMPTGCPPVSSANNSYVTCQPVNSPPIPVNVEVEIQHHVNSSDPKALKAHKAVNRSSSSNPRLELGPSPTSPIPTKRQPSASVCAETLTKESHPGRLFQKNPNLQKTILKSTPSNMSSSTTTTTMSAQGPCLTPQATKKPLSRLIKSPPPGSLVPPTGPITSANSSPKAAAKNGVGAVPESPQESPNPGHGLKAAFYRGLSIDPRRGSTTSQATAIVDNNNTSDKIYSRKNSTFFQGRFGQGQGNQHQSLSQMNSNSSSQFDRRYPRRNSSFKGEPLPWCGCWGNGCI